MRPASPTPFRISVVSRATLAAVRVAQAAALGALCASPSWAQTASSVWAAEPELQPQPHLQPQLQPQSGATAEQFLAQLTPATGAIEPAAAAEKADSPAALLADIEAPLRLKLTPMLVDKPLANSVSAPIGTPAPATFVSGERISGRPDLETVVEGDAQLRRGAKAIRADRLEYVQPSDTLKARGNVRITSSGNSFTGPELELKVDASEGFFTQPSYRFLSNGGNGSAERIDFVNENRLIARNATFTTCERDNQASWAPRSESAERPAWQLSGSSFDFDNEAQVGVAKNAVLRFQDVPILAVPILSFPLGDTRKSGLLPPSFNLDSTSGAMVSLPYYFNIAPNRDATVTPTIMSKRGLDLAGEARYIEGPAVGVLRGNYMPSDKLRGIDRWSYSLQHVSSFDSPIASLGRIGLNLDLKRVSDDNYWRDFPRGNISLTQRLLSSDAKLYWSQGFFTAEVRALKWQTLQDPLAPITPPYDRLPQIKVDYKRLNAPLFDSSSLGGFDYSLTTDFSRFAADSTLTGQTNGSRAVARAQISRPFITPGWFVTPKLSLHTSSYRFDTALADGSRSASRVVPTFSLDSGLQFERQTALFGRNFTQTLEPRAFYVRTPFRDQSLLPNYDSGSNDFNFATVFTENAFVGDDRISDANLLTLGVTSRLLDSATGAEAVRVGVAQRLRLADQNVTLPGGLPVTDRISDILFGTSIKWSPAWTLDGTLQYNQKLGVSERSVFGVRYSPSNYRVISASLRRQRDVSNSIDVGWQWPLNDLWGDRGQDLGPGRGQGGGRYYTVGRLNYSVQDKKLVDGVLGIEYDGCCWLARAVVQRSQSGTAAANTRILFELELVGFSRLGTNPLTTLKSNIPRYQLLRDQITSPSRFTQYD